MTFTWTIPSGAPIYKTSDDYTLQVTSSNVALEDVYTVFLANHIEYGDQVWDELVSYDITVVNPCINTEIFANDTIIEDYSYTLEGITLTQSFTGFTDTISNSITTSGNCGNIVYVFTNDIDATVGTGFLKVVDLLEDKGLRTYAEDEDTVGEWTITMRVYLEDYPAKTGEV